MFLGIHPLVLVCSPIDGSVPVTEQLERPYFGLDRLDWTDAVDEPGGIEFNRPISDWFNLFDRVGFDVTGYREVRAPTTASGVVSSVPADWARRFPSEQVWWLCKR